MGIDAPRAVRVIREELIEQTPEAAAREQRESDQMSATAILSDAVDRKLNSLMVGLEMLVKELQDRNHDFSMTVVEGLQGEARDLCQLREVVLQSPAAMPEDEPPIFQLDIGESNKADDCDAEPARLSG